MASKAFLKISNILNNSTGDDSANDEIIQLLQTDSENTFHYISAILKQQSSPSINVRLVLNHFIETLNDESTLTELLSTLTPPTASINQPLVKIHLKLSDIYRQRSLSSNNPELLLKSTDYLQQINLDLLINDYANDLEYQLFKVDINLRIVNNLYTLGKYDDCEAYVSRIFNFLSYYNSSDDEQYRKLFIDSNKISIKILIQLNKWLEAASKLTNLKRVTTLDDYESTLIVILSLLSKYNTYKTIFLKENYKNERDLTSIINTPLLFIFNKFVNSQIIYADEYEDSLKFMQLWTVSNSERDIRITKDQIAESYLTIVLQHNIIATSKVYANITFENLKQILNIYDNEYDKLLEQLTSDLIIDGHISGAIDDIERVIEFRTPALDSHAEPLDDWNKHIVDNCQRLDDIVDQLEFEHPDLALVP